MNKPLIVFPSRIVPCLIYHDESKNVERNVWAHALLFVPESSHKDLLNKLWDIRKKYNCLNKKLHFSDISGSKICESDGSIVIKEWIEIGVEALKWKSSIFNPPLACKIGIIFFDNTCYLSLYGGNRREKELRFFETVLRMALKGCTHYLYDKSQKLEIKGILSDGQPWHRPLDELRILNKLKSECRSYVTINKNAFMKCIISDHSNEDCKDKDSSQILQLTDLLLGCAITSCFRKVEYGSKKEKIVRPFKEMLDKRKRGTNFRYSSHFKSFNISFARVAKGKWMFENVMNKELIYKDNQLKFSDFN